MNRYETAVFNGLQRWLNTTPTMKSCDGVRDAITRYIPPETKGKTLDDVIADIQAAWLQISKGLGDVLKPVVDLAKAFMTASEAASKFTVEMRGFGDVIPQRQIKPVTPKWRVKDEHDNPDPNTFPIA